jgi:tetratricopeptide (TPR) repeat protein
MSARLPMNNTYFQRGMLLYQQGRYQEAVGELRMQLAQDVEDSTTHGALALALSELEQHAEATEHAQRAIHLAPDEAYGHYALARVMLGRKRFQEARAAILEAIRLDPYEANYFGILALLELGKSRWREALEAANQGLQIEPEHGLCTNMRAQALVKLGDRAAAAATMDDALARRPDDAYTHANQGWALLDARQPYQALEHFREALRLDPELEWARAGIVEAMKARNIVYRLMLAWFLWMSRLTPGVRWGLVIGAYFGSRFIGQMAKNSPELAPYLWPLLYLYIAFVVLSWLSPSFFNLLLRLDRFGRYALSPDQVRGANVLAVCLIVTLGFLVAAIALGSGFLLLCTLMFALLALPASAIYVCEAGWPRHAMAAITLGLLAMVLLVFAVGLLEHRLPAPAVNAVASLVGILPLAMIASQFAAIYLTQVTPRK